MQISVKFNEGLRYGRMPENETYVAVDLDTYDCDCDQDGFFSLSPVGHGATEAEAIADLMAQLEEVA
jgi:hypothetical protein